MITNCSYNINQAGNVIEIPDVLDGRIITGIGDYAFFNAGKITELILPSSLEFIGNGAFEGHALTLLEIPTNVTSIGNDAFAGNALSSINFPSGLESIGSRAFEANQLSNINLPDGLITLGGSAFRNNQINILTIPNSLEIIPNTAFAENQITSLTIPNSVRIIQNSAFANNQITSLTIPNSVEIIERYAFLSNKIETLTFQSGCQLEEISDGCFQYNYIQSLAIPNSILQINRNAFRDNTNLSGIAFGSNLLRIKRGAFRNHNLSSVNLPASLVFIGKYAFQSSALSSFNLPSSSNNNEWADMYGVMHNEGESVFDLNSSYVAQIPYTFKPDDVVVENGIIVNCSYFDEITNVASVITIPSTINGEEIIGIGEGVFFDRGISQVVLPEGIQSIGASSFQENEIINLTIPNSVITIGDAAFNYNCINSIAIEEPSQLEIIGRDAFSRNQLTSVNLPESLIKIEMYAFASNWLQTINFNDNSKLISIGRYAFDGNGELTGFKLPDPSANDYDYWVDWDNTEYSTSTNLDVNNFETFYKIPIELTLTDDDVVVVDGVIVRYTPSNPYANVLTIPDSLDGQEIIGIGSSVFASLGLISVNLPTTLKIIENKAFAENDLLDVIIPGSVEGIQGGAFNWNLIDELIFEENSQLRYIDYDAFSSNKISSLILPDSVDFIGTSAFAWNQISNGLIIPDSLHTIENGAFKGNQISSVSFSGNSSLSYLGESAFANNRISNDIVIPPNLTEISNYAFQDNNISMVITHDKIVEFGYGAFADNEPALTIELHEPPTIPLVTYFFWWKDNYGNHYDSGEIITNDADTLNFYNRYKAVIDQFFVVTFVVTDNKGVPLENALIDIFNETLTTSIAGIDSIGPVLRGLQEYTVGGVEGCFDFTGVVDVQSDTTIYVELNRYYGVDITVIDIYDNPIEGASILINNTNCTSDITGNAQIDLINGDYPFTVNLAGYLEYTNSITVHDTDKTLTVKLLPVMVRYFPNEAIGETFIDTVSGSPYTVSNNLFSREGYSFLHWNSQPDDTDTTYSENEIIILGFSNLDLYAIWDPIDYNIIYYLNGGINDNRNPDTYNIEGEINLFQAAKDSMYFATWIDADSNRVSNIESGTTGDIELWAIFTPEPTYFIDYFNLNNASHNNPPIYTQFDLPFSFTDANKTGYWFAGWFEDSLLTQPIGDIPVGSKSDYDIYAKWGGAIEYIISYELYGGQNNPLNPVSYTIENDDIFFENPTKTGANFVGWYSDQTLINEITGLPNGSVGDTTIYVKWELDTFKIEYMLNGGINNSSNPSIYTIDSEDIIFESPNRAGAMFIGWYSDANLEIPITEIPQGSYRDTTIYAKWELDVFKIDYMLDGGINHSLNPANYTIESDDIVFEKPTKTGAVFIGWYSDEDLQNKIVQISNGSIGDRKIYAKWELDIFNIQYQLNGGENDPINPSRYTIESNTIVFAAPVREGFIFEGWYINAAYSEEITSLPQGSFGDTTIYANWIELFDINFIITTDGTNPAMAVDVVIDNMQYLISDEQGFVDTVVADGSSFNYSVEIAGIVITEGNVNVSGNDVTVEVEIVNCYMRWYDVIFCDNGKGIWTDFSWYSGGEKISSEPFFHNPGGIEDGNYKLVLTSAAGVEYTWEKDFVDGNFDGNVYISNQIKEREVGTEQVNVKVYPSPVQHAQDLKIVLSENSDLQNTYILIYDIRGSQILKIKDPFYINDILIDSNFSSGTFYVILIDKKNKRITTIDFIVN
ncbi:leucine-rich repeat protein [uncultured Draconibacterium sp.]|uniref:leucine-rich repeat protein n=1 Tax=uncultured Draconibacterium sp. TaxID=1573823 RepID=UPI0029C9A096|nr:leucine-rich repeat protein [uncultured Draconibacterium sp.]